MSKKLRNTYRSVTMKLLYKYKCEAQRQYMATETYEKRIDTNIFSKMYEKLKRLRCKIRTLKGWILAALHFFNTVIQSLVSQTYRCRLIYKMEGNPIVAKTCSGIRIALPKCLKIYKCFKKEIRKFKKQCPLMFTISDV